MIWTLLTFKFSVITYVTSTVPQWNMHHSCDKIIGDSSLGGFMSFDSDQLPWNHQYECSVQVRPALFDDPHRTPRILFHFSDVEIGHGRCDDANLTVVDGSFRPWDYHHDTVKGGKPKSRNALLQSTVYTTRQPPRLKTPMCGTNYSLTSDLAFTSSNDKITLIFRRNSSGVKDKASFNMTFIAFYEGPCDENDEAYTCDLALDEEFNKCINEEFVCLGINPCGDNSDCPDADLAEAMTWWESLLNLLRTLAIFLGIIVCFIVIGNIVEARYQGSGLPKLPIIRCIYDRLSKCRNTQERRESHQIDSQPVTGDIFSQLPATQPAAPAPPAAPPAALPDNLSRTASISSESSEDSSSNQSFSSTEADLLPTAPPPDYGTITPPAPSDDQQHIPLPPSYNEVIANADKYSK